MELLKKHKALIGLALALVLVPSSILAAQKLIGPAVVNCEAGNSCAITVNVPQSQGGEVVLGASAAQDFTDLTALHLTGDLTASGTMVIAGTSTFSGDLVGVPAAVKTTMSSSATTTACAILNSSGLNRTVISIGVRDRGTAASTGAVMWQAGTTTYPGIAVAATEKVVNSYVTRVSGVDAFTTTSTAQSTSFIWRSGEYLVLVSGTTTNAGDCRAVYL